MMEISVTASGTFTGFSTFINNLSPKQYNEFAHSLREFFAAVVQHLESREKVSF